MILTCPACVTKYVVKDDAIPPQGRQVRCASCKHSWHQDPEAVERCPCLGEPGELGAAGEVTVGQQQVAAVLARCCDCARSS